MFSARQLILGVVPEAFNLSLVNLLLVHRVLDKALLGTAKAPDRLRSGDCLGAIFDVTLAVSLHHGVNLLRGDALPLHQPPERRIKALVAKGARHRLAAPGLKHASEVLDGHCLLLGQADALADGASGCERVLSVQRPLTNYLPDRLPRPFVDLPDALRGDGLREVRQARVDGIEDEFDKLRLPDCRHEFRRQLRPGQSGL